jgi:hypothetical protein
MAAPVLQLQGVDAAVTTGNLTVGIPAGEVANDILVVTTVAWVVNTTTGANTIAAPAGWTKFTPDVTTITSNLIDAEWSFFWRRATSASEADPVFVRPTGWDTGNDTSWAGRCYVIRGAVTTGNPWDAITNTAVSAVANPAFPAITVSGNERMAIVFAVKTDDAALPTAATGYTVGTFDSTTTGTDAGFNSYRVATTNTTVAAVTPSGGAAPAQGGTVYFGVSFVPSTVVTVSRTATGSGTGTQSASRVRKVPRTATGSGTGTQSATGVKKKVRTASGSGVGTQSATGASKRLRSATGSGLGSSSTTTKETLFRTATGSGLGSSSNSIAHKIYRNGQGAGQGSTFGGATGKITHLRTATGSGIGTQNATGREVLFRTATGLGDGSSTALKLCKVIRTAADSGLGTQSAAGHKILLRTATGSGTGVSTALKVRKVVRTSTSTGAGTSVALKQIPPVGINWSFWGTNALLNSP